MATPAEVALFLGDVLRAAAERRMDHHQLMRECLNIASMAAIKEGVSEGLVCDFLAESFASSEGSMNIVRSLLEANRARRAARGEARYSIAVQVWGCSKPEREVVEEVSINARLCEEHRVDVLRQLAQEIADTYAGAIGHRDWVLLSISPIQEDGNGKDG